MKKYVRRQKTAGAKRAPAVFYSIVKFTLAGALAVASALFCVFHKNKED